MRVKSMVHVVAIGAMLFGSASTVRAQTQINTTTNWNGSQQIGMFGALPANTAIGQTFTTPTNGNLLDSFSFWLNANPNYASNILFRAYVMGWNGSEVTGPVLWESGNTAGPNQTMQQYVFSPNGLVLTPGGQYVAFLSTIGLFNNFPTNAQVLTGFTDASYSGGHFVDFADATNFAELQNSSWTTDATCPSCSAAFTADFRDDITTTPEPSSLVLLGTGLVGLVPLVRRRKRQAI